MVTVDANIWIAAFDPHDRFHEASTRFLTIVAKRRLPVAGPAFVVVECACALARRTGSAGTAAEIQQRLFAYPHLMLLPIDERLLTAATALGIRHMVRGADALYVAAAHLSQTQLISWDDERCRRAGAMTAEVWLEKNG